MHLSLKYYSFGQGSCIIEDSIFGISSYKFGIDRDQNNDEPQSVFSFLLERK
jgi:hypothetical protein